MKVGIMTFPNSVSYGATLQMLALQKTVSEMGHQVEVINYHNPYMKAEKHVKKSKHSALKFAIQSRIRPLLHRRLYASFRDFERRHVACYPPKAFTQKDKLPLLGQRYDAVICGSDQVWCPRITGGDLSYFLDFCGENTRRISYAPSFGGETFSEEFYRQIGPELERFSALSVREMPGIRIVENLTGREAALVADPTFLVEKESGRQWKSPTRWLKGITSSISWCVSRRAYSTSVRHLPNGTALRWWWWAATPCRRAATQTRCWNMRWTWIRSSGCI